MARKADRKALGRGLSALLGDPATSGAIGSAKGATETTSDTNEIPIDLIQSNPDQPRQTFRDEDLSELSSSIKEHGVLQPVLLRPLDGSPKRYQIVAGERRWRAAQLAGIHTLPAVVREIDDRQVLELAIIENVQRVDLDPIEEAQGYSQLIETFEYTQEKLSKVIGKSRSHLANTMRLLALPTSVTAMVKDGRLSAGHARALIKSDNAEKLAEEAVAKGLSVRQIEALAKATSGSRSMQSKAASKDADTKLLEGDLSAAIGMRVSIENITSDGTGELRIRYKSLEQLDELCQKLTD